MEKDNSTIRMTLPKGARKPTDEEIRDAKNYILRRSEASNLAQDRAGELILDAAEKLVSIAYKYDIPISQFQFDESVNEFMMEEVDAVMNALDEALYDEIGSYATMCTDDNDRMAELLAALYLLGHRNMNLRQTLHAYEWRTLRQAEALIAAYKAAGLPQTEAINKIKASLGNFSSSQELQAALRRPQDFAAPYIRNGGRSTFPDGSPNVRGVAVEGYNAIKFLFGAATAQIWMRNQLLDMQEDRTCIGYWQDRGSTYPCKICDDEVGFHELGDAENEPYPHWHCYCWRLPIYSDGSQGEIVTNN